MYKQQVTHTLCYAKFSTKAALWHFGMAGYAGNLSHAIVNHIEGGKIDRLDVWIQIDG